MSQNDLVLSHSALLQDVGDVAAIAAEKDLNRESLECLRQRRQLPRVATQIQTKEILPVPRHHRLLKENVEKMRN